MTSRMNRAATPLFAGVGKPHGVAFVRPARHGDIFPVGRIAEVKKVATGKMRQLLLRSSGGRLFHPKIFHAGSDIHERDGDLARNPTRETISGLEGLCKFELLRKWAS